jgi:hypothetical protein
MNHRHLLTVLKLSFTRPPIEYTVPVPLEGH